MRTTEATTTYDDRLLDARQIAMRLGVTAAYVYRLAALGQIETVRLGRRCVRFPASSVEAFVAARRSGTAGTVD
jgi:excisionase family DNA binding protein